MHYLYYKKKSKIKFIVLSILVLLIILAVIIFTRNSKDINEVITISEKEVIDNRIKSGTLITKINYLCNHSESIQSEIPVSYIGKTLDEIKEKDKKIHSVFYDNNILSIEMDASVKCDQHYKVQLIDNLLNVICEKFPDKPQKKIKINLRGLYEDEVELLKNGIEFGSKESMLEFLEDFES